MNESPQPPAPPPASSVEADKARMFEQLARALLAFGARLELSPEVKRIAINRALESDVDPSQSAGDEGGFQELLRISEVFTRWHREPEWLDALGQPEALPLTGRTRSFTRLADGLLPPHEIERIVRELIAQNMLIKNELGHFLPRRRVAGTPGPHPWMLNRIPAISRALNSTIAHNYLSASSGEETLCERGATITIAKDMAGEFNLEVKRLAQPLIDHIDNLAHSPKYQTGAKTVQAGVQIFAYLDNHPNEASS